MNQTFNPKPKPSKREKKTPKPIGYKPVQDTKSPEAKRLEKTWNRAKPDSVCNCGHSKTEHSETITGYKDLVWHGCSRCSCGGFVLFKSKPQVRQDNEDFKKDVIVPENMRMTLEHQLDALVSKHVIKRDGRCVVCGSLDELTAGHYQKRQYMLVRFDYEFNVHCQCRRCNEIHNQFEKPYRDYIVRMFDEAKAQWLDTEAKVTHKWSEEELLEMVKEVKFATKQLTG